MTHPSSSNEVARLAALDALCILDTAMEERFDRFTRLATQTFQVPIALISLVDRNRQWFKSRCGIDASETVRSIAFCSHAIALGDVLVVENALADSRFSDNPLVVGEPHIRFYAGQPIYSEGEAVGTLCIIDHVPRSLNDKEKQCLRDLAGLVESEVNHVKVKTASLLADQKRKALNFDLERRIAERTAELESKIDALSREISERKAIEISLRQSETWNRTIVASSFSGFIGINQSGHIVEWNTSAERIFGWKRSEAVGARFSELILPPHLRADHESNMQCHVSTGESPAIDRKVELSALTSTGRRITVAMTMSAYEWQGQQCFGAFMDDVSEQIRMRLELEEKQELLDAVLETIDVAVVACDAVGNLTLFNRMARSVHGLDLKSIAPVEWSKYYSLYHVDGRSPMAMDEIPLVRALKGEVVCDQGMVIAPQASAPHTMLASGRPLHSDAGRLLGAVVAMHDITELNASREKIVSSERQLRAVTENLPAMIGRVDAQGRFAFLNNRALQVYGKTADEVIGQEIKIAYSDEDFARITPHLEIVKSGKRVFFEYVVQMPDRQLHYQCSYVPQFLPNGMQDGFLAMAHDITKRKLVEMRLEESEERLRTITDNLPILIAQFDGNRRYSFANAIHQEWLGQAPENMLGKTMAEALGPDYQTQQTDALEKAWGGTPSQCEHEIITGEHTRIMQSNFLPQKHDGIVTGVCVLTSDATASRIQERNLHTLAHTDTLTGLPNRRHFNLALNNAATGLLESGQNIALLYLDIDHFKTINDSYGHGIGDEVLVEFARRLRAVVRGSDVVSRLAGDEFTVLLSNVNNYDSVTTVARNILKVVAEPFVVTSCSLDVRTTIGIAVSTQSGYSPELLIDVADRALYSAKSSGRNTFAVLHVNEEANRLSAD